MNCIMSNQWERKTTQQLNEQKEQIDKLDERLNRYLKGEFRTPLFLYLNSNNENYKNY